MSCPGHDRSMLIPRLLRGAAQGAMPTSSKPQQCSVARQPCLRHLGASALECQQQPIENIGVT